MSIFTSNLLSKEPWEGIVMGNHALARAMIEADTKVITTYPGSPTPEIAQALQTIPETERPFYFEFSTNEKVALEVAFGATVNGNSSTVFFKSVGLNVAADSAVQLALMELVGGMVIILGDDPGANSSQNEQDNRRFAQMAYIPILEPGNPQEAYDMYLDAMKLSQLMKMPVFLRMTTHVCHAKQKIKFGKRKNSSTWKSDFSVKNGPYLPITKLVFPLKKRALEKLEKLSQTEPCFQHSKIHSFSSDLIKPGIITYGLPFYSVLENIEDSDFHGDVLQLKMVFPLPEKAILEFIKIHKEVLIVEELDRVIETEIKALAFDNKVEVKIFSRNGTDALMGELNPVRTNKILSEVWPDIFSEEKLNAPLPQETLPRIPQMCPGCGHRSAFHAIKKAIPEGTITVGDIGCHSLGFFPPYNIGEVLLCMGHSSGTGAGLSIKNERRKVISILGDSTFFHAGLPAIINAVVHQHDLTLIIMENGTTAMTGHQPHAGSKEISDRISIQKVLEAMGVKNVQKVDTYNQKKLTEAIKSAMDIKGFSVVIAIHPCMLKFTREARKKGSFNPKKMEVLQNCNQSYNCVSEFACPSFMLNEDKSVSVNKGICIGDGSCKQVCPISALEHEKNIGKTDEVKK